VSCSIRYSWSAMTPILDLFGSRRVVASPTPGGPRR